MKVKGVNNSSKKTRQSIRKEFANQIKEKGELQKVTVTELANNIGITRGAFYSHYDKIDDVAKEIQEETLELLKEDINSLSDINLFLDKINLFLKENNNLYSAILKSNDPLFFTERLNKLINKKLIGSLFQNNNSKYLFLNISVFVDGILNLYIKYFRKEINLTLDEINTYSKDLFYNMFIKDYK